MKKCVCLLLTICMTLLLTAPAFAARTCDCGHEPVIYVPGFGKSLYAFDEDGAEQIYPPQKEAFVKAALPIAVAAAALVCGMFDLFADYGMRAAFILLGRQGCGDDGSIPPGTGILSDNLPTEDVHGDMAEGIADYTFNYDWRLSPLDNAQLLRFLQRALDSQFERVFYNCLRSLYGTMPGIWSFVSDKYYDRAKAFTFCGEDRFAALEAKTDEYHYEVQ